ncbi:MAG: 3'-5' exonuclease [Bacteriovoracaceae bacterium]
MQIPHNLNVAQVEAVKYNSGPLMILAGAGSGKTRTLVAKLAYLIDQKKLSPYQILALTFSNKASKEMRDRVADTLQVHPGILQITTFHSFCATLLRKEYQYLGLSKNFTIYDDSESLAVIKSLMNKHDINQKEISPYSIAHSISHAKNFGYYVGKEQERGLPDEEINEIEKLKVEKYFYLFSEYEQELHRSNAVDFGGLITGTLQLFRTFPEVLRKYQEKFQYILVDEYQDTNKAQFELLKLISEKHRNICVVGDEDQSIYSWRGADIRNILDFESYFPETKVIKLEQNYRSSKIIIEAASKVIARNEMRKGKEMWTENLDGEYIDIVECGSDKDESDFVATEISQLVKSGKATYKDFAIFYRNNSQSRVVEDELMKCHIPYKVIGGIKFYDRKEIKDILSYVRLVVNHKDSLAFSRVVNTPTRGIGATTLRKLETEAIHLQLSLFEMVEKLLDPNDPVSVEIKLSSKVKSSLKEFVDLIKETTEMEKNRVNPSECFYHLFKQSGYLQYLQSSKDYESIARKENIEELYNAIKQYEEEARNQPDQTATLVGFLESISLDMNSLNNNQNSAIDVNGYVSLMTVHGAKGLEFPYTFIVGMEENLFPSIQSLDRGLVGQEEERRLFYVAMTRAMKKLYICFAQARMLYGQLRFNGPSLFIHEIPSKYFTWIKRNSSNNNQSYDYDNSNIHYEYDSTPAQKFPPGKRVIHSLYGEGKILSSDGYGDGEKVHIQFSNGAQKRFMVKFTPLVLIS